MKVVFSEDEFWLWFEVTDIKHSFDHEVEVEEATLALWVQTLNEAKKVQERIYKLCPVAMRHQLPPLPLVDGCLLIDNSIWVEGFSSCYRYLEYKALWKRILKGEDTALNFGSAMHLALEYRYRHYQNKEVDVAYYDEVAKLLTQFFQEHPLPEDDWRNLNWAMETVKRYCERYQKEDFNLLVDKDGKTLVELSFALPLFTYPACAPLHADIPVIYTGRIDLPISINNRIFVMDHKTTEHLGDWFWTGIRMSDQPIGYVWAFEQLTGMSVAGYAINGIRTKNPPQYVLDGKPYRGKTKSPAEWWNESLQREVYPVEKWKTEEWRNNTINLVEEFFWNYSRGNLPMKRKWCSSYGRCPYYDVCLLYPNDRQAMLQSGLFKDNDWTPLK